MFLIRIIFDMEYNRVAAVRYARQWANSRNPEYYDFEHIGGDCTNFISQCVYAGSGVMNFTPNTGWFFVNINNRAPSWTSVDLFYKFLTQNRESGPYGADVPIREAQIGDVIQLSFDGEIFSHSLIVVNSSFSPTPSNIEIAAHSYDAYGRTLDSYFYREARLVHIFKVNYN